jgi:hypothetical protein
MKRTKFLNYYKDNIKYYIPMILAPSTMENQSVNVPFSFHFDYLELYSYINNIPTYSVQLVINREPNGYTNHINLVSDKDTYYNYRPLMATIKDRLAAIIASNPAYGTFNSEIDIVVRMDNTENVMLLATFIVESQIKLGNSTTDTWIVTLSNYQSQSCSYTYPPMDQLAISSTVSYDNYYAYINVTIINITPYSINNVDFSISNPKTTKYPSLEYNEGVSVSNWISIWAYTDELSSNITNICNVHERIVKVSISEINSMETATFRARIVAYCDKNFPYIQETWHTIFVPESNGALWGNDLTYQYQTTNLTCPQTPGTVTCPPENDSSQ